TERRVLFRRAPAPQRRRIRAPGPARDRRSWRAALAEAFAGAFRQSLPVCAFGNRRRSVRSGALRMPDPLGSDLSFLPPITRKPLRLRRAPPGGPLAVQRRLFPDQNGALPG